MMKYAVAGRHSIPRPKADMPIIMCTGLSDLIHARKAQALCIKAFAMKPLTKREITMNDAKSA